MPHVELNLVHGGRGELKIDGVVLPLLPLEVTSDIPGPLGCGRR